MRRTHHILAVVLLLLFVGWSFNAYACLVPLFGVPQSQMEQGCATPSEQSANQFCEAFKTLGIQGVAELLHPQDTPSLNSTEALRISDLVPGSILFSPVQNGPTPGLFLDRFVTTIVLRI